MVDEVAPEDERVAGGVLVVGEAGTVPDVVVDGQTGGDFGTADEALLLGEEPAQGQTARNVPPRLPHHIACQHSRVRVVKTHMTI